jgi:hypothetical protein
MKTGFKLMLVLLFTGCIMNSFAQDTTGTDKKIREYVVSLTNFVPLHVSIKYKRQLKGRTFFKVELINLSGSSTKNEPELSTNFASSSYNFSGGLQFGLEFRKNISGNFTFFHGPGIGSTYSTSVTRSHNPSQPINEQKSASESYNVGINYSLGVLFHLKGHFFLSTEISPGVYTNWNMYKSPRPEVNSSGRSSSFSFSNTNGLLSLVYRL